MNGQFQKGNKAQSSESAQRKRLVREALIKHHKEAIEEILSQLKAEDTKDRQWAVKTILEYTIGKPEQSVDVSDSDGTIAAAILQFVKKDAT